jgi:hypothetical protein
LDLISAACFYGAFQAFQEGKAGLATLQVPLKVATFLHRKLSVKIV